MTTASISTYMPLLDALLIVLRGENMTLIEADDEILSHLYRALARDQTSTGKTKGLNDFEMCLQIALYQERRRCKKPPVLEIEDSTSRIDIRDSTNEDSC